jgi:biopolymer transport protein ExbD
MKFKRRLSVEAGLAQIDFASFVNVAFLLIDFFLLTSKLLITPGFALRFPKYISKDDLGDRVFTVAINNRNEIFAKGKPLSLEVLQNAIKNGDYTSIFIQADSRADLSIIGRIYQICRNLKVERIGLATTIEQ